jgi:hypothetical protein
MLGRQVRILLRRLFRAGTARANDHLDGLEWRQA